MSANELVSTSRIDAYEEWAAGQPQVPIDLIESFPEGLYVRTIIVRAGKDGVCITGARHNTDYFSVMEQGVVSVWDEQSESKDATLLVAPFSCISKAGTRKIGIVHEDMKWTDVFPNPDNSKDGEAIMASLVKYPSAYFTLKDQGRSPCLQ